MNENIEALDQAKSTIIDLAIKFGPKLVVAIIIVTVGYFAARWVSRPADKLFARLHIELAVQQFLTRVVYALVMLLFIIMALQNLGVELLPLIAGLGIAGAGIALAMQGVLGNLVAGLTIIFTRPFRIGEYISIVGEEGVVEDISLFSTVLLHPDRSRVVLPNRKIVGEVLHNYGSIRQLDLKVGVAYDTVLDSALAVVREVVAANPRVLKDPEPIIGVAMLADSAIEIAVRPWVQVSDFRAAGAEINQALVLALRSNDISIPFPQREVRLLGEE
ncbi:MAG: mechanosensitive ion channel domain-containing protein [Steroidobacteraceae bacterium]